MKKIVCTCVSSTKLDFSVGSFDFRLQVEADHHAAAKHTHTHSRPHGQKQQHTPLTQPAHSAHRAGSIQTTGAAGDSAHTGGSTQTTGVVANSLHVRVFDGHTHSGPHGQKQQHTPLTQPAHSAHTADSTQTTGAAGDNSGQRRAGMESVCPLGVCTLSVSTAFSW